MTVLLIETKGPHSGPGCATFLADGVALAGSGAAVRVLLLGDGSTAAVPGAVAEVDKLVGGGAEVLVDEFSARRRGIGVDAMRPEIVLGSLDTVAADVVDPGVQVVWH